ncbi:SLAIN motif-containing protein-like isoform X1 [Rhinatrema bivittatum]|uniref:SLAIN motif-containing protein-like isoform X1 n=1 Tax=Rhinatrema bivittatum TaxID=194408 RepID=UPI00112C2B81|nr:SLAIN motif-containing protein-like isoform X1 [Rhinatrema bivittatum]XP_029462488.1 SLAIN motif-containing protein-like isoform X1 [Rhinatrema bivittatum]
MKMVVPGSAPVIQQDHVVEPVGRGSIEDSAMGSNAEPEAAQVGTDLAEVRKLQELVSKLQSQKQQLNTVTKKSQLGENASHHINAGLDNYIATLNGMEINDDSNTITEKQELKIMADLCNKLSKITDKENRDCLRTHMAAQMQYENISSDSKHDNNADVQSDSVDSCFFNLDAINCTELLANFSSGDIKPSAKLSDLNSSEKGGNPLAEISLDEVEVLELGICSEDEEDSWLYVSPKKKPIAKQKFESPLKWCRQVLDHPSPETEAVCRTLISRLDQASRWKTLYCSPLASPSAHNPNTETSSCSNALNSPGYLKSTNKQLLTCGSSGYLSIYSALSSQSSVDSELSTSDDSISMGYKLQDLTDVQVMARLQEESLRQDYASSSASVSRRSSSASLHSLRRGTYSDQEFDAYSLEDDDDNDCSLSYRSTHRYSPSPLSSPRCQSPSAVGDHGKGTGSRIRPPRRPVKNPAQDRMKYTSNEEDIRHSMPNLARTNLRSLESVRNSRSLESDLQVPNSRLTRIQQPATGLTPTKLRYSPAAMQSPLTIRQPVKAVTSTSTLLSTRQPVKSSGYGSPSSEIRKMQSGTCINSSSISSTTRTTIATAAKSSPVKSRTSSGGAAAHKSKMSQPSRRSLQSSKNNTSAADDDSWKEGCY